MAREPMNQNQKFALVVFGVIALAVVWFVFVQIRASVGG